MHPIPYLTRLCILLPLAVAMCVPRQASSADMADAKPMSDSQMMAQCDEMKAQKQKIRDDAHAQDVELTKEIAAMNSASADAKVDAMALVITHMLQQRMVMDARKNQLEDDMMKHMMKHMQMGKDSMSHCPMMQDMDTKPGDAHHH